MKKKQYIRIAVVSLVLLLMTSMLTSCAASSSKMAGEQAPGVVVKSTVKQANPAKEKADAKVDSNSAMPANKTPERKLITRYNLEIRTEDFAASQDTLNKLVESSGGYRENASINQYEAGGRKYRNGIFVLRIPADKVGGAIETIRGIGELLRENVSNDDVTAEYMDSEARLRSLRNQEKRLNELYKGAGRIEDLVVIEAKLGEVIMQIERLESSLKHIDNQVEYVLVEVHLSEREIRTEVNTADRNYWTTVKITIRNTWINFIDFLQDSSLVLIELSPYLLLLFVLFLILLVPIKSYKKRQQKRREAWEQQQRLNYQQAQMSAQMNQVENQVVDGAVEPMKAESETPAENNNKSEEKVN